jgi:hypothetical protein
MTEDTRYGIITTESGQQITTQSPSFIQCDIISPDDPVVENIQLDISPDEFTDLQQLAETNDIPDDTIKAKAINI